MTTETIEGWCEWNPEVPRAVAEEYLFEGLQREAAARGGELDRATFQCGTSYEAGRTRIGGSARLLQWGAQSA